MDRFTKVSLLLISTCLLWLWLGFQPVLDGALPNVSIGHKELVIPISEVFAQCLCIFTVILAYCLYSACAEQRLSLVGNLAFLLFALVVASGNGIHVASVIIQRQLTPEDAINSLVDFLHERWSHNTFLFGFYAILLVTVWAEKSFMLQVGHKNLDDPGSTHAAGRGPSDEDAYEAPVHSNKTEKNSTLLSKNELGSSDVHGRALKVGVRWVLPVVMGLFLSIFAAETTTKVLTCLFYLTTFVVTVVIRMQLPVSLPDFIRLCSTELIVLGFLVKASSLGLVTLFLY